MILCSLCFLSCLCASTDDENWMLAIPTLTPEGMQNYRQGFRFVYPYLWCTNSPRSLQKEIFSIKINYKVIVVNFNPNLRHRYFPYIGLARCLPYRLQTQDRNRAYYRSYFSCYDSLMTYWADFGLALLLLHRLFQRFENRQNRPVYRKNRQSSQAHHIHKIHDFFVGCYKNKIQKNKM